MHFLDFHFDKYKKTFILRGKLNTRPVFFFLQNLHEF